MSPRVYKFALLTCLYIAQGLPFGFFMQSLPVLLRNRGMSLEVIGFSTILVLPWAFKFLWAPVLDKWGKRRTWILVNNLAAVALLLLLASFSLERLVSEQITVLFAGFFILNLFSATQDIATDGLAVNLLNENERGFGNGIQVAGYRVGMILGGGLLLAWFTVLGWQYSLCILAAILLAVTIPIVMFSEVDHHREQENLGIKDFIGFIKLPHLTLWLAIVLTYKFGEHFASAMIRPLLIDQQWSVEQIALVLGSVGFAAGLAGALVGGLLVNRLGRYNALLSFGVIQAGAVAIWAIVPLGFNNSIVVYSLSALEHFAGGLATAALFTVMMDHCRRQCAGSDYTFQASIVVFMNMIAAAASGVFAARFGYGTHFVVAGFFGLLSLPLVMRYRAYLSRVQTPTVAVAFEPQ